MRTILIVDDEARIRGIYGEYLCMEGFRTVRVSKAENVYEALKNSKIDLVLLDIKMPQVNGAEIGNVIRHLHKRVRIIVSSVYPVEEQKKMIPQADEYFDKAQGIPVLLEKINNLLGPCLDDEFSYIR